MFEVKFAFGKTDLTYCLDPYFCRYITPPTSKSFKRQNLLGIFFKRQNIVKTGHTLNLALLLSHLITIEICRAGTNLEFIIQEYLWSQ